MSRFLSIAVLWVSSLAFASTPAAQPSLLPSAIAGWKQISTAPLAPSPSDAPALQEYGLVQGQQAVYASGSARLALRAWRFRDATGAVGAFTWQRQPQMHLEKIGHGGAADGQHFIFWTGATVIEADLSGSSRGPVSALKALATKIPQPSGAAGLVPPLFSYVPAVDYIPGTIHYALGPAGYTRAGSPVPTDQVGFAMDAEALTAEYGSGAQRGLLTLLMYPTPQIAAARLKAIQPLAASQHMSVRRSGPLLAILSGNLPPPRAAKIIAAVRFNDIVTINHPEGYENEVAKLAHLLFGIAALIGILLVAAILLGLFLGGGRALVRKLRGKPVSSMSDEEFIALHLNR
jgi:hypothetical protein